MKRYKQTTMTSPISELTYANMKEDSDGAYVTYADAQRRIEELELRLKQQDIAYNDLLGKYNQLVALNEEQP